MTDDAELDSTEDAGTDALDPATAAALIRSQDATVRAALDVRLHEQLLAWGIAWLVGLGAMWWQVRDQDPYVGPRGLSTLIFSVLLAIALALTMTRVRTATAGLSGRSARAGSIYGFAWGAGLFALFGGIVALSHQGATPRVVGVFSTGTALALTGVMYLMHSAIWGSPLMLGLGLWLVAVAVIGALTGPVLLLLIGAVAGGGGLIVAGLWLARARLGTGD